MEAVIVNRRQVYELLPLKDVMRDGSFGKAGPANELGG